MNDTIMVCEDTGPDESGNEACSTIIQFFRLPEAERFRVVCICQRHAEKRGYHAVPRICTDSGVTQVHLIEHPVCKDEQLTREPECFYNFVARKHEREKNPLVFFIPTDNRRVTLCKMHAHKRGYFTDYPRQLTETDGKKEYDLQCRTAEAKRTFVQVYHPELVCRRDTTECKSDEVTEYYFSDGSLVPLCTVHRTDSDALMSREYYDQVYSLRFL